MANTLTKKVDYTIIYKIWFSFVHFLSFLKFNKRFFCHKYFFIVAKSCILEIAVNNYSTVHGKDI